MSYYFSIKFQLSSGWNSRLVNFQSCLWSIPWLCFWETLMSYLKTNFSQSALFCLKIIFPWEFLSTKTLSIWFKHPLKIYFHNKTGRKHMLKVFHQSLSFPKFPASLRLELLGWIGKDLRFLNESFGNFSSFVVLSFVLSTALLRLCEGFSS